MTGTSPHCILVNLSWSIGPIFHVHSKRVFWSDTHQHLLPWRGFGLIKGVFNRHSRGDWWWDQKTWFWKDKCFSSPKTAWKKNIISLLSFVFCELFGCFDLERLKGCTIRTEQEWWDVWCLQPSPNIKISWLCIWQLHHTSWIPGLEFSKSFWG